MADKIFAQASGLAKQPFLLKQYGKNLSRKIFNRKAETRTIRSGFSVFGDCLYWQHPSTNLVQKIKN